MSGTVYLVGAGPGDPGLLTLKGKDVLCQSDCVVYDHLVNPSLLEFVPWKAERIFAGKQAGRHYMSQEKINEILIRKAQEGRNVVRLKGGDPFIFGRGGEEAEALAAAGVRWEIVPGVSSAYSVPAYAGIPVTHRDYSSSVAFVTGHEENGRSLSRLRWDKLATGVDTLVFLMCAGQITNIVEKLLAHGRPPLTPAAIISRGTYENQGCYRSTLKGVVEFALQNEIPLPAMLVVGDVVSLSERLQWFNERRHEVLSSISEDREFEGAGSRRR